MVAHIPGPIRPHTEPIERTRKNASIGLPNALSFRDQHFVEQFHQTELTDLPLLNADSAIGDNAQSDSKCPKVAEGTQNLGETSAKPIKVLLEIIDEPICQRAGKAKLLRRLPINKILIDIPMRIQFEYTLHIGLCRDVSQLGAKPPVLIPHQLPNRGFPVEKSAIEIE